VAVARIEIAERIGDAHDRPVERVVGIALGLDECLAQEQRECLVAIARQAFAQPVAHRLLLRRGAVLTLRGQYTMNDKGGSVCRRRSISPIRSPSSPGRAAASAAPSPRPWHRSAPQWWSPAARR